MLNVNVTCYNYDCHNFLMFVMILEELFCTTSELYIYSYCYKFVIQVYIILYLQDNYELMIDV